MELSAQGGAEINQQKHSSAVNFMSKKQAGNRFNNKAKEIKVDVKNKNNNTNSNLKKKNFCFRCGDSSHISYSCQYKKVKCKFCGVVRHLQKVCFKFKKSNQKNNYVEEVEQEIEEILSIDLFQNNDNDSEISKTDKLNNVIHNNTTLNTIEF